MIVATSEIHDFFLGGGLASHPPEDQQHRGHTQNYFKNCRFSEILYRPSTSAEISRSLHII